VQDKAAHIAQAMTSTSYAASGATIAIGGFTANEIAALIGALLALATFAVNWYYRHKTYQLEKAKLRHRIDSKGD